MVKCVVVGVLCWGRIGCVDRVVYLLCVSIFSSVSVYESDFCRFQIQHHSGTQRRNTYHQLHGRPYWAAAAVAAFALASAVRRTPAAAAADLFAVAAAALYSRRLHPGGGLLQRSATDWRSHTAQSTARWACVKHHRRDDGGELLANPCLVSSWKFQLFVGFIYSLSNFAYLRVERNGVVIQTGLVTLFEINPECSPNFTNVHLIIWCT